MSAPRRLGPALAAIPLAAMIFWFVQMAGKSPGPPSQAAQAARSGAGLFPSASAVGASHRSPTERFVGTAVYDYLDGGAEVYLHRGLQSIAVTRYDWSGDGSIPPVEIETVAMRFATPGGATAQAASLVPGGATPVEGLSGAVATGSELVLVQGHWLLHLLAEDPSADVRDHLIRIAAAWSAMAGGRNGE